MANQSQEIAPQTYARIGGVLYLIIIAVGLFAEGFVRNSIIVSGDAAATVHNIMASASLWRWSIAAELVAHVADVGLGLIFYVLLRPVNKNLALLMLLFDFVQTAVMVANKINLFAALSLAGGAAYLKVFDPNQLNTLAYLAVKAHSDGFHIGLIFFGFECLILGYLVYQSRYLPKLIGVMMQIAGVCYLVACFANLFVPTLSVLIVPAILLPPFIAESSFCLWLLVKGVNANKWNTAQQSETPRQ